MSGPTHPNHGAGRKPPCIFYFTLIHTPSSDSKQKSHFPEKDESPSFAAISSSASESPGDLSRTEYSKGPTPRFLSSSGTPLIPGTMRAVRAWDGNGERSSS